MKPRLINNGQVLEEWVPFELKQRGGRKELSMQVEAVRGGRVIWPARPELALIIAKGHALGRRLDEGFYPSVNVMAQEIGMDASQLMKYVRLRNLAPDIIEGILAGTEPKGLKQDDLLQSMPLDWEEQRRLLGFPLRQHSHSPANLPVTAEIPARERSPAEVPAPPPVMSKLAVHAKKASRGKQTAIPLQRSLFDDA